VVNVKKYCEQAFAGEGNHFKYRRLSPHFTRSKLLVELKKKVHYDSIVIQDVIDTYLQELIAKKEVYEVMGSEEENTTTTNDGETTTTNTTTTSNNNNTMVDDVNNDKYTIELPFFYDPMCLALEEIMKLDDQEERVTKLNQLALQYEAKNWLTPHLVFEIMDACRYGAFTHPVPPIAAEAMELDAPVAAAASATTTTTPQEAAAASETAGAATEVVSPTTTTTTTAMDTAMAMAVIATETTTEATAATDVAASGTVSSEQQQQQQQQQEIKY